MPGTTVKKIKRRSRNIVFDVVLFVVFSLFCFLSFVLRGKHTCVAVAITPA